MISQRAANLDQASARDLSLFRRSTLQYLSRALTSEEAVQFRTIIIDCGHAVIRASQLKRLAFNNLDRDVWELELLYCPPGFPEATSTPKVHTSDQMFDATVGIAVLMHCSVTFDFHDDWISVVHQ